jgi:hypothetical protein
LFAALALGLLLASPASAVFTAREMDALDTEGLFDSEYFLDLLGFSPPLDWRWAWQASSSGYRVNGASLDRSDLLLEQDLKLTRRLNDGLAFRYDLVQRGDKDLVELHHWLQLEAGPWRELTGGLFGEPEFSKEDADIGLFLRWARGPWMLRGAMDAVDFSFNQRGRTSQSYHRKPVTWDLRAAWTEGGDRVLASAELDEPLERSVPADGRLYGYRRTRLALSWDRPASAPAGDWGFAADYAFEYKREQDYYDPDPSRKTLDFRRTLHTWTLAGERLLGARDRVEAGARLLTRSANAGHGPDSAADIRYRRWELQPYGRWRRELRPWAVSELALFLGEGEQRRAYPSAPASSVAETPAEAKLGTGVDFVYGGGSGRLGLYGHWDLDDAGRHVWDGGNIRAMFLF